jgi:hypothetical protein
MRLAQDEHYIISDSSSTILKDLPLIKHTYLVPELLTINPN